jgi:REP element-mobilizing transposase RayT
MGSTFYSLRYHIVFSTKERRPFIRSEWRERLHAYLGGIIRNQGGVAEAVGGVEDHVHLLASLKTTHCIADLMRDLKKDSSSWAAENFEKDFSWQEGYSVFSVSANHAEAVKGYIATQEAHHRKTNFLDELKTLLEKNGVKYEEKYLE